MSRQTLSTVNTLLGFLLPLKASTTFLFLILRMATDVDDLGRILVAVSMHIVSLDAAHPLHYEPL